MLDPGQEANRKETNMQIKYNDGSFSEPVIVESKTQAARLLGELFDEMMRLPLHSGSPVSVTFFRIFKNGRNGAGSKEWKRACGNRKREQKKIGRT